MLTKIRWAVGSTGAVAALLFYIQGWFGVGSEWWIVMVLMFTAVGFGKEFYGVLVKFLRFHRVVSILQFRPASAVEVKVVLEESEVSYNSNLGAVTVHLRIGISNGLDVDCGMQEFTLSMLVEGELINLHYGDYRDEYSTETISQFHELAIRARSERWGWLTFYLTDKWVRMSHFEKFIFTAKAIGEPEQTHYFYIYDKDLLRTGRSPLASTN